MALVAIAALMAAADNCPRIAFAAGAATTGQAIMVNLEAEGAFTITDTEVYVFNVSNPENSDPDAGPLHVAPAISYYTNAATGTISKLTVQGGFPTNGTTNGLYNQAVIAAAIPPAAPAPDASKTEALALFDWKLFADGTGDGTLSSDTYSQTATTTVNLRRNSGTTTSPATLTYTFDYSITPNGDGKIAAPDTEGDLAGVPKAAYDLYSSSDGGGTVHAAIHADIAGESWVTKSGQTKYSFSIIDGEGNRVQNLAVSVDSVLVGTPGSTVNYPVDFTFMKNAGSNGDQTKELDGDARTILNSDYFAGNNNGGADGSALALVTMDPVGADIGEGDHTVSLTGLVKGNSAAADATFTVTKSVHVVVHKFAPGNP